LDTFNQVENKFDKKHSELRESSPVGSSKPTQIPMPTEQDAKLDDSELNFMKQQEAKTSLSSIDKTINMQVKNINE